MQILRFTAEWCGPCKKLKPIVERIQQEHPDLEVTVLDVDTALGRHAADAYAVSGVPTLIALDEKGTETARLVGAHPKGKVEKVLGLV